MKSCKNCDRQFQSTEDEKAYYAKLDVPEPSWCPPCREIRRMAWCNEGTLYEGKCHLCERQVITQFSPDNPRPYYCIPCWWSDKWNALDYGREIDWNRSIFEQIHELELEVPHGCVGTDQSNENSEYIHHAGQARNCYLIFHGTFTEDCYYGYGVKKAKNCVDVHYCHESELCYECIDLKNCYGLAWSQDCVNCSTSAFLKDCIGCMDCFMCVGLRNKKYCFMNEQLSKEEYEEKMKEVDLGSYEKVKEYIEFFNQFKLKSPVKNLQITMVENSIGDHLLQAKNAQYCFDCSDIEESKYCSQMQLGVRYCMDIYQYGVQAELCYESSMVGTNAYNIQFCYLCLWQVANLQYCIECYNSKDCFACFGLNHAQYCILNKEYSKEEYFDLKEKLIEKMRAEGEYGEFFPIKYSQSAYNETTAQLWSPLNKEEVLAKGWQWQENLPGTFGQETLSEIPNNISEIGDITNEILKCGTCSKNYKIISQEFNFYTNQGYPIPRECFDCRRLRRMKMRNPRKFWTRSCMKCSGTIKTSYSTERHETVYCEKCYKEAIY